MTVNRMCDDVKAEALNPAENVSPIWIGLAMDYMTRFMSGTSAEDALEISKKGSCTRFIRSLRMLKYLGIYNPRVNTAPRIAVEDISDEVIKKVEKEVIGYEG